MRSYSTATRVPSAAFNTPNCAPHNCQALPHTSLVLVSRKRARVRFARPSMFIVPRKLVFMVLMGLYLCA